MKKARLNKSKLAGAYRGGASVRKLAKRTGRSYGTVHNALKSSGVKMRARGGANHTGKK